MIELIAAVSGALVVAGLIGAVMAVRPTDVRPRSTPIRRRGRLRRQITQITRRSRILLAFGLAGGVVVALITGWVVAIIVIPIAAVGLPYLLSAPPGAARIDKLDALEEWTRSLSGLLVTGAGLEEAIALSLRSVPEPIRPEVTALVARLRARVSPQDALRAFADDLDDETGDRAACYLIVAANRRGGGLTTILDSLAQSVASDVSTRRRIEADRKKPLAVVRIVAGITTSVLGLLFLTNPEFMVPYGTPLGQVVLLCLLGLYAASLLWLRRWSISKPYPRFLGQAARQEPTL